jgi:hypothetical protein
MDELEFVSGGFSGLSSPDSLDSDSLHTVIVTGRRRKWGQSFDTLYAIEYFEEQATRQELVCNALNAIVSNHNDAQEMLNWLAQAGAGIATIGGGIAAIGTVGVNPGVVGAGAGVAVAGGALLAVAGISGIASAVLEQRAERQMRDMGCPNSAWA